jgi:hypothetical protein
LISKPFKLSFSWVKEEFQIPEQEAHDIKKELRKLSKHIHGGRVISKPKNEK